MPISAGELEFYNLIKDNCKIIFDVGCRADCVYIENSSEKEFHLFEPNPLSYKIIQDKVSNNSNNKIFINNFGLGNTSGDFNYYVNSESFMPRPKRFLKISSPILLHIKKFSEYIEENNISFIDFLKIDTEGWETDIIFDNVEFIKNNVKYIQFEYASTWTDRELSISFSDVYNEFFDKFLFYFLLDHQHPISKTCEDYLTLIDRKEIITIIDSFVESQYGFNIAMIKKDAE